jgi:tetratricopeptide (TPR) repeat protein
VTEPDLLAQLHRTLSEYETSRDPAVVLALQPLDVAARLVELVEVDGPGSGARSEALAAAGLLHWYRALLMPAPDDEPDLDRALELFTRIGSEHSDLIPVPVRQLLHREQSSSGLDPEASRRLELCSDLLDEYRESHDPEVLRTAIALLGQAQTLPGAASAVAALHARLHRLALEQYEQYQRTGDTAALDEAVAVARVSLSHTDPDDPATISRLSNLSLMLRDRYEQRAQIVDLDEAMRTGQTAAALAPGNGSLPPDLATNLGLIHLSRFRHDRHLASLDEAVHFLRDAVVGSGTSAHRGRYLSNLAVALRARHDATGRIEDLDAAVGAGRAAVATAAPDDRERGRYLSNLATALRTRHEVSGDASDLDDAIEAARAAVATAAPDDRERGRYLSNLATALRTRHEGARDHGSTSRNADLDLAINAARAAVDYTAAENPDRADRLTTLAMALMQAGQRDAATAILREAASHTASRPAARVSAAQAWARSAASRGDFAEAAAGFAVAVRMLPLLVSREVNDRDQALRRSGVSPGLTADAVASALRSGQPLLALELWEQGHGIMLDQELQLRSDLSHLAAADPALAHQLAATADALNAPVPDPGFSREVSGRITGIDQRMQLAHEWDQLVEQARYLPGFEDFLRPPRAADLLAVGADGPVVLINVSQYGADALLVTAQGLDVVPLPGVIPLEVQAIASDFIATFHGAGTSGRQRLLEILAWLWDAIAGPVLNRLGLADGSSADERPRLWWCPAGDLVLLPLHAAAQSGTTGQSVLDLVTSSYTPTLRALQQSRTHPSVALSEARILAVGMPYTPGAGVLPLAMREIQSLTSRFPDTLSLMGKDATRASVLAALPGSEIVHFACHGFTRADDPAASGLVLTDGSLTVTDILALRLGSKELAVLSACETAAPGISISDEPVHLASALQLAGYRHVIGTLQPVMDHVAAQITEQFYTAFGRPGQDSRHIAHALSDAIRNLRDRYPASPERWSLYIHIGP